MAILKAIGLLVLLQAQPTLAGQTGGFIPSSQLLTWCKSKDGVEMMTCFGYVSAIAEATGNTAVKWPKGNVAIPGGASPDTQIAKVVAYIEAMPREKLSSPASDAVYEALVAAWPRKPIGPAPAP